MRMIDRELRNKREIEWRELQRAKERTIES